MKPDPSDPNGRMGVPPDKMGTFAVPLRDTDPATGERRDAVVVIIYPPAALRDAPREVVEVAIMARKAGILATIIDEVYRSYTSDPVDGAAAQNIAAALTRHATATRPPSPQ